MEANLQINVKGITEELAREIGHSVGSAVVGFKQADPNIDFRRMHRIIVAADFAGALAELSSSTTSGNPISHTAETYAVALGKVLILPRGSEFEIVPVFDARVGAGLLIKQDGDANGEHFRSMLHVLHHELVHVHDNNQKLDALHKVMMKACYQGKEQFILPLAEQCWSEYFANLRSSSTATKSFINEMTDSFADAIERTKRDIDIEILSYRSHHDLHRLLNIFQRHGGFLAKCAAYVLGYSDGLKKPIQELNERAANTLKGSYFEPTWDAMHQALRGMLSQYPQEWNGLSVYDELATALDAYYNTMGFVLSTEENGLTFVEVPFRPETMPAE